MLGLDVRPVLTAHPTESTRRTLLGLQARVADALLARELTPAAERHGIEEQLDGEVELLWLTSEIRQRPSLGARRGEHGALVSRDAPARRRAPKAREALVRAFEEEFARRRRCCAARCPLRIGNWVGGDRDGNPFVTPDVTIATARRASYVDPRPLRRRARAISSSGSRVSAQLAPPSDALRESLESDRRLLPDVWEANRRRNADEPVRLKLSRSWRRASRRRGGSPRRATPGTLVARAGGVPQRGGARARPPARAREPRHGRRDARLPHDGRSAARHACARTACTAS